MNLNPTVRWLLVGVLVVALVVDVLDGDPIKLLGTGLLLAAAVLSASGFAQRAPAGRLLMLGALGLASGLLLYRLLFRHA